MRTHQFFNRLLLLTGAVITSNVAFGQQFNTLRVNTPPSNNDARVVISPSDPDDPSRTDGLIIPRINGFPGNLSNGGTTTAPGANSNGMIVFLQQPFTGDAAAAGYVTGQVYPVGFYYWSGTQWLPISNSGNAANIRANNGLTRDADSILLGGMLSKATTIAAGDNRLTINGAKTTPNANALISTFEVTNTTTVPENEIGIAATSTMVDNSTIAGYRAVWGAYNSSASGNNDAQVVGGFNEAATTANVSVSAVGTRAVGVTGASHAYGAGPAGTQARVIGITGFGDFPNGSSNYNAIGINGYTGDNTTGRTVGGHFDGTGGATQFGVIGSVEGTAPYEVMYDPTLANSKIGVAAVNLAQTPGANSLAMYTRGQVRMMGLGTTTATSLIGSDGSGNLSTLPIPATVTAGNGLTKNGNIVGLGGTLDSNTTINQNNKQLAFTNANQFSVNRGTTAATQSLLIRNDGSIALGNSAPVYSSNKLEINLQNVGGTQTSGEENQGVNILGSALNGSALTVGLRSRMDIPNGSAVTGARGMQSNLNINGGLNGGAGAVFFNTNVGATATLGSNATITGISGDAASAVGAPAGATTNRFTGGRFGADATNTPNATAIGVGASAIGSATSNTGVNATAAIVGTSTNNAGIVTAVGPIATVGAAATAARSGRNAALVAVNPNAAGTGTGNTERAIYSSGGVQMTNLGATTATSLMGIDGSGNLSATPFPATTTAGNGLTKSGNVIGLGGTLDSNTTINSGNYSTTFSGSNTTNQTSVLKAIANPGNALAAGTEIFAGQAYVSGQDVAASATSSPSTFRGQVNQAATNGNNVRVQGSLNEASSTGTGLGAFDLPQAVGATGYGHYQGATDAPATDYVVGLRGATTTGAGRTNALNIVGMNAGGTFDRSVGGYFAPTGGGSNLGTIAQVGGASNQAWRDTLFTGKNVGMAAVDYNAPTPQAITATNLAVYSNGNVQFSNLPTIGSTASIVGIDSNGNLSKTLMPAPTAAGSGLTQNGHAIDLGGILTSDVLIDGATNNKSVAITGNGGSPDGILKIQNNITTPNPVGTSNSTQVVSASLDNISGSGTLQGDIVASSSEAYSSSDDFQVIGSENFATTPLSGMIQGNYTHAIGTDGIVFANGNRASNAPEAMVLGVSGGISFNDVSSNWNGIGTEGYLNFNYSTSGKAAGGHFDGNGTTASGTGFGLIGSMGDGPLYQTIFDPALDGYHIGVAAVNHTPTPTATDLALYTEGNVKMKNLSGGGTDMMTLDATGNVGFVKAFAAQSTLSFNLVAANDYSDITVSVPGVVDGDAIYLGVPSGAVVAFCTYTAWVSAADVVTVRFTNNSASTQSTAGDFKVKVMQ